MTGRTGNRPERTGGPVVIVSGMTIDDATLQTLIGFTDDVGVLSFYAGFTPDQAAAPQPVQPIEIRNQIRDLKKRLRDERPHDEWVAVERVLDRLEGSELEDLLDPKAPGRGRALFVAVSDGRTERVHVQVPFRERVVLDRTAYVRPLVTAFDEGRPAGVVIVSRQAVHLLEWRIGECVEVASWDFELGDAQLADIKSGPAASGVPYGRKGMVNRERFEDRIDDNRHRFLRSALDGVTDHQRTAGWDRVVVAGSPKIRDDAAELLDGENGTRVICADHDWEGQSPAQVADAVWPLLRSVARERERALIEQAKDRALSGGAGALGLRNVLKALNTGQVEHLLFDADLSAEGYVGEDGTLHARVGGAAAQAGIDLHRDPLFVERMVEKVFAMGGRVTPCEQAAAALLDEHEGVAALLRW